MFLAGRIDDAAAPPFVSSARRRRGWLLLRGRGRGGRELLEQVRRTITNIRELLVQRVAVHPAFGLRLNGPNHPSELLGKRHDSLLDHGGCRRAWGVGRRRTGCSCRSGGALRHAGSILRR
jgi:hypothetical protein